MANYKNLFRKASLTLVDGLLLVLCAASLAYLSVPSPQPLWQQRGAAKHGEGKVSLDNAFALIERHQFNSLAHGPFGKSASTFDYQRAALRQEARVFWPSSHT